MTNEEIQEIVAKADDEYDRLKDRVHEQYDEIKRLNNIINETIDKLNEMKISMLIDTHNGIEIDSKFVDDVFETIKFLEENKELKGSDKE